MPLAIDKEGKSALYLDDSGEWKPAPVRTNPQTNEMVVWDGKAWIKPPWMGMSAADTAAGLTRSVASGATAGFAPEIEALIKTPFGDKNIGQQIDETRKAYEDIPPRIKIPGEVVGAVGAGLAAAPLGAAAGAARIPAWLRGPLGGAVAGAIQGAGHAKPDERLEGAALGGAIGVGTGAIIPPSMAALGHMFMPEKKAAVDIGRAIRRDEMTPDAVEQAVKSLQNIRPGATAADVGGENLKGLVERVAQTPGAGRTTVVPFLEGRQKGQMDRIADDLRSLTGTSKSAFEAIEETMTKRKQDATPFYDAAFNFNAKANPEIVQAWAKETADGFGRSFMLRPEFRKTLQTEYGIKNPADAPLMVQINAWKIVADDFIGDNIGTNKARIVKAMRDRVIGVVDQHNPAYATARDAWAGPSQYLRAIEDGKKFMSKDIGSEEMAARLKAMPASDAEGFRLGAISAAVSKMRNETAELPDVTKHFRSPEMRDKIAAIMPTPEAAQKWATTLDYEIASSKLTGRSLGNSATARRLAEQKDAESLTVDLIADAFMGKPPIGLIQRLFTGGTNAVRDTVRSRTDKVVADVLTGQRPLASVIDGINSVRTKNAPPTMPRAAGVGGANEGLLDLFQQ